MSATPVPCAISARGRQAGSLRRARHVREGSRPSAWRGALVRRHDAEYDFSNLRAAGDRAPHEGGGRPAARVHSSLRPRWRRPARHPPRQGAASAPSTGTTSCITGEAGNSNMTHGETEPQSDWGDTEMRDAKGPTSSQRRHGAATPTTARRARRGPSMVDLLDQMTTMFKHKSGERHLLPLAALRTMPPERAAFSSLSGAADSIGDQPVRRDRFSSRGSSATSQAVARPATTSRRCAARFGSRRSSARFRASRLASRTFGRSGRRTADPSASQASTLQG